MAQPVTPAKGRLVQIRFFLEMESKMFKKSVLNVSVAAALLLTSGMASAESAHVSLPVSASVAKGCTISAGAGLAFGAYDPISANATARLTATGSVIVACAKNSSGLTIGMGLGAHADGGQRQMINGTDLLAYDVGQPSSNAAGAACNFSDATAWTDVAVLALTHPESKAPRNYNVCGSIPAGQDVAAGLAYTDTVVATINF